MQAARYFVLQGQVNGLGYMTNATGAKIAAPVDVSDRMGGRMVMLDFEPQENYWDSQDGATLLSAAAAYAAQGAQGRCDKCHRNLLMILTTLKPRLAEY